MDTIMSIAAVTSRSTMARKDNTMSTITPEQTEYITKLIATATQAVADEPQHAKVSTPQPHPSQ